MVPKYQIVIGVLILIAGYALGVIVGWPASDRGLLGGDVSKAYSNANRDPEVAAVMDKLQNDASFMSETKNSTELLKDRAEGLVQLTTKTLEKCSNIAELQEVLKGMVSLQNKAKAVGQALTQTGKSLDKMANGKDAPEYEQLSENGYINCLKMENGLSASKDFVKTALEFLKDKDTKEYQELTQLIAEWTVFNTGNAVMNDSETDFVFWQELVDQSDVLSKALVNNYKSIDEALQEAFNGNEASNKAEMNDIRLKLEKMFTEGQSKDLMLADRAETGNKSRQSIVSTSKAFPTVGLSLKFDF